MVSDASEPFVVMVAVAGTLVVEPPTAAESTATWGGSSLQAATADNTETSSGDQRTT
jgi:hypothetical protein